MQHLLHTFRRVIAGGLASVLGILVGGIFGLIMFIPATFVAIIARLNGDYKKIFPR